MAVALTPAIYAGYVWWRDVQTASELETSAPLLAGLVGIRDERSRAVDGFCRPGRDGARNVAASKALDERVHEIAPIGSGLAQLEAHLTAQGFKPPSGPGEPSFMYLARRYGPFNFDSDLWTVHWQTDQSNRIILLQGCSRYNYMGP